MEETNLFVEVNTSTFQIWDERPLCRIVPTALTVSPSCAEEMWFPLTCIPTTISSGSQIIMEPSPATVSAKARVAPPCKMPKGWRVRWSTGMVASTRSSEAYVYWMPKFPINAWRARSFSKSRGISAACTSSSEVEAENAEAALKELVCKYVPQKKIIKYINSMFHCDHLCLEYDKSCHMWSFERKSRFSIGKNEWYNIRDFTPNELKNEDVRDELTEELEEDDFINLLENCKDIAFYEWSSSGYSQGDYVRGYAYCDKERFKKMVDTNTKNWKNRAIELFESEVKNIGMWMWGDVKGYVLEKKRPYTKLYEDGKSSDSYEWEQIDSCWGEYYEDSDELIKDALEENGIKLKETA